MDSKPGPAARPASAPVNVVVCLNILAALIALAGTLAGVLAGLTGAIQNRLVDFLAAAGILAGSWSVGAILWALAWLVRRQQDIYIFLLEQQSHLPDGRMRGAVQPLSGGAPPAVSAEAQLLIQIADRLDRLADNLSQVTAAASAFQATAPSLEPHPPAEHRPAPDADVLTEHDIRAAESAKLAADLDQLAVEAQQHIQQGDLSGADEIIEKLRTRAPDDRRLDQLAGHLDRSRAEAEAADLAACTRQVDDLMAVSAFRDAEEMVLELLARFPDSRQGKDLLNRVQCEAEKFSTEQRRRLTEKLHRCAEDRQWVTALEAARKLIRLDPDSEEAKAVALQMPTIESNARIEEVRRLRDEFRDLLDRKRYTDAFDLAQYIVGEYPETAAGRDLKEQLPALKQKSART